MPNKRTDSSIDTALSVIDMLQSGRTLRISQVASTLEIAPSTAHRILSILTARGYARRTLQRRYVAGPQTQTGYSGWLSDSNLMRISYPTLQRMVEETEESCNLVVLEGAEVAYLGGVETRRTLRVAAPEGLRLPAIASGAGKALLATHSSQSILTKFSDYFPNEASRKINTLEQLLAELQHVRDTGFGTVIEEFGNGVSGIGTHVDGADGRAIAGIAIAIPTHRFHTKDIYHLAEILHMGAREITRQLTMNVNKCWR